MNIDAPGAHRLYTKTKSNHGRRVGARAGQRNAQSTGEEEDEEGARVQGAQVALPPSVCAHLSHGGGAPRDAALHAFYTAAATFKIARCATQ